MGEFNRVIADTVEVDIMVYDVVGNIVTTLLLPGWEDSYSIDEGDSLRFSANCYNKLNHQIYYEWKLNNQVVVSSENSYLFKAGFEAAGSYTIDLKVWDEEYGAVPVYYSWNLVVNNVNRAPIVNKSYPESGDVELISSIGGEFSVDVVDPDSDKLSYRWYLDGVKLDSDHSDLDLKLKKGEYSLICRASDGELVRSVEWNLYVEDENLPKKSEIITNYPNPFNPITTLQFSIADEGFYKFRIYNMKGQVVKEYSKNRFIIGTHSKQLNFESYNSGIYFIEITGQRFRDLRRVVLLK
jgi:hypothetical protein